MVAAAGKRASLRPRARLMNAREMSPNFYCPFAYRRYVPGTEMQERLSWAD
jgi:hypothetical protein